MRIAFLSCIHGNLQALERVDRDVAACYPDAVYCLGDVIGYGAQPRECIDLVRARGWPTLLGNHEEIVLKPDTAERFQPYARAAIYFSMGALTDDHRAWIRTLPETIEGEGFQLVHGSTHGIRTQQYVLKPEEADEALRAASQPLVFNGHTHVPMVFHRLQEVVIDKERCQKLPPGRQAVVNVGSVGQPRDRDARACWVLYDTVRAEVEYRRLEYDNAEAARRIREAGLPVKLAERLMSGY
jgi:diadenosine tetraphosphatase ApaH/serine/threonine PP2A family protein phosphatase